MSKFTFKSPVTRSASQGIRSAFSDWLLTNHGGTYRDVLQAHRARPAASLLRTRLANCSPQAPTAVPMVGIVGGGFAGLFAGLILQSLGIGCELFESSDRVGGRIRTWYSPDYAPGDKQRDGLYGELGGMRVPQFSQDMLPVQQLALSVNAVLKRNGLGANAVTWRKFFYSSPAQRMRFNNMPKPVMESEAGLSSLNFGQADGGSVPQVWLTPTSPGGAVNGGAPYLPINMVLEQVNKPFLAAFDNSFAEGFAMLMQFDQYSMWDYLTTVFTLGDMGPCYAPALGAKSDLLPWSVASFLETTNVGSGMYAVSFVEMVIAVYDWGGSVDPYRPLDHGIYMITVDQGMQRFPDACRTVLDLDAGVTQADGVTAQVQVGMRRSAPGQPYSYTAPNLTRDAQPPAAATASEAPITLAPSPAQRRVFLQHEVVELTHDKSLYGGHGGMRVAVKDLSAAGAPVASRNYPYVITTLPGGAYLNGQMGANLLNDISLPKAQALRECDYMAAFKAFLTFKRQFWTEFGPRQAGGYGAASTDRANRQIIYPSYGYDGKEGVLQVYCWAQDARRLGALSDQERVAECLKGIQYLYPEVEVAAEFAGYDDGRTTKTWFWDQHAGGGAFALFNPGQFKNLYATLLTPEFDGCLNFAGEGCSVHHGWIVGAMDSAYNAVRNILLQAGANDKLKQMQEIWGTYTAPDVAADTATDNVIGYCYLYNALDRQASAKLPGQASSIYGSSTYVFNGHVPAFVADFSTVPQTMKATPQDKQVLQMLNDQWDDNVRLRAAKGAAPPCQGDSAAALLESIYGGHNFQTIPAPAFWLKDDDEFARQQLAGFMPNLLTRITSAELLRLRAQAGLDGESAAHALAPTRYVADYRRWLRACTTIPVGYCLPKPMVFFGVSADGELMPIGIQLQADGELFTPDMPNAANAWLLAKMLTNCAGQTLHDVGFHQLLTHQICSMVSIALFSEEVFTPGAPSAGEPPFQTHPVFKLLRPHVVKALEFQQSIYNSDYDPSAKGFPDSRSAPQPPGVYNIGFVYDLIFSCGRIGNYQLQDHMYNDGGAFRFLDWAIPKDAEKRGVAQTPFSYPYVHDSLLWYRAMARFVAAFVDAQYPAGDAAVANDRQLQRFFDKLLPAFNYIDGQSQAQRMPSRVLTVAALKEVLTMFVWQFSVQHTVVNDGAYEQAAFVPNASTLMYAPPAAKPSSQWTPQDVLACLPSLTQTYPQLGGMTFTDVQINASVTGQGPYPETVFGRGVLEPALDVMQDLYGFVQPPLRAAVDAFFDDARGVDAAIRLRQARDTARYLALRPRAVAIPQTVVFERITSTTVMNAIQT